MAVGRKFNEWGNSEQGRASKKQYVDFLQLQNKTEGKVPKAQTVWLREASLMATSEDQTKGRLDSTSNAVRLARMSNIKKGRHVAPEKRLRTLGNQGRPDKCPLLYELLWDWFVDYRASVRGRLSSKFVLKKAKRLAEKILAEQRKNKEVSYSSPKIDKHFLSRWKLLCSSIELES